MAEERHLLGAHSVQMACRVRQSLSAEHPVSWKHRLAAKVSVPGTFFPLVSDLTVPAVLISESLSLRSKKDSDIVQWPFRPLLLAPG